MQGIDYFASQNKGLENIVNAFSSNEKENRQKGIDAMNAALHQKQLEQADFTLGEAKEKSKRNRATLADIARIGGLTEKIPASISVSPLDQVATPPMDEDATPGAIIQSKPAVNYTPQEKHQMIVEGAASRGDYDTVTKYGNLIDVTNKIKKEDAVGFAEWGKAVGDYAKIIKDPAAVQRFAEELADRYGVPRNMVGKIRALPDGIEVEPVNGGGKIITKTLADGTQKVFHEKAADTSNNLVPTIGPDGKPVYGPKVAGAAVYEKPAPSKLLTPAEEEQRIRISKAGKPVGSEEAKEELAQSLARGDMTRIRDVMSLRSSGGGATALEIFNRARQINPKFSTAEIERKIKMESDFTTGKDGQNLQSFGTFLEHAAAVDETLKEIGSTDVKLLNKPVNWLKKNVGGDPKFQAFLTSLDPVQKEFMTFLLGGRALYTDDRTSAKIILDENSSPAQIQAALKQMGHTAKARYQEANYRYKRVMGKDIEEPFSPEAIQAATKIGVDLVGRNSGKAAVEKKTIAGKNYIKQDGKWFEE